MLCEFFCAVAFVTAAQWPGAIFFERGFAIDRGRIQHDALAGASGSGTGIAESSARV